MVCSELAGLWPVSPLSHLIAPIRVVTVSLHSKTLLATVCTVSQYPTKLLPYLTVLNLLLFNVRYC